MFARSLGLRTQKPHTFGGLRGVGPRGLQVLSAVRWGGRVRLLRLSQSTLWSSESGTFCYLWFSDLSSENNDRYFLERCEEKWKLVFRPRPALNFWN